MALKRIDPPRQFTSEEAQQWFKLQETIESALGASGLSNTLFVDGVNGDDDTAVRGSLAFKYLTIQAALDAALAGDTIWVTPGTYTEDLTWPDTNNLSLKGTSPTSTVITNATAVDTISIVPTVVLTLGSILDIAITNSGADLGVNINGAADAGMFSGTFRMSNVLLYGTGGVTMQTVNGYDFRDIQADDVDLIVTDCGNGTLNASTWDNITVSYAAVPATAPTSGNGVLKAISTVVKDTLTVNTLGKVEFSKDTEIRTVAGAIIDAAADFGYIHALGVITGNIAVTFDLQNAAYDVITCDFAKILSSTVTVADAGTPSLFRGGANFRNANFLDQNATITAGAECDMDLREALFNQAALAVAGDGAIDRSVWIQTIQPGSSPATPVPWANGAMSIPYVTAPDSVHCESAIIGELPIAVIAKIAASVTCQKTLDAGVHIVTAFKDYVA